MENSNPLITIITPCLNMVGFIEETLKSVAAQQYERVEHIVLDGGSTDGTLSVLERFARQYPHRLRYISQPDKGTADALERGLRMAKGEIFGYLNADDIYAPGTLQAIADGFGAHPSADVVFGDADWIDESGNAIGRYPVQDFDRGLLARGCIFCQPATFVRTALLKKAGGFNTRFESAFDYELWLRLGRTAYFRRLRRVVAKSRMHAANKTLGKRGDVFRESIAAVRQHTGYVGFQWVHGYAAYLLDGRDQYFEELRPSFSKYILSLPIGLMLNWEKPHRYLMEWGRVMSTEGLMRRWNGIWARH